MKKQLFFIVLAIGICVSSFGQHFNKVPESKVDILAVQISERFATSFFMKQKEGRFYQFKNEAIDSIKDQLTKERQASIYKNLKDQFGDFESLKYAQTWVQGNNRSISVFRFKAYFDKTSTPLEVRVVLNDLKKVAGFWIKPWQDELK